ncbi:MAG: hypothetical protein K2X63_00120 [Burkholderiaceae bacterium]|nr:hypothetical protein [Burkholderiaceae bacterium]
MLHAKELLLVENETYYPFSTWLRLPVFLQKAGEFDQAIAECEFLLTSLNNIRNQFALDEALLRRSRQLHLYRANVYDKMRLICKKERKRTLELRFENMCFQEHSLLEGKEKLIETYESKATKGDQNACAVVGHEWKCDQVTDVGIDRLCKRCGARLHEPHI